MNSQKVSCDIQIFSSLQSCDDNLFFSFTEAYIATRAAPRSWPKSTMKVTNPVKTSTMQRSIPEKKADRRSTVVGLYTALSILLSVPLLMINKLFRICFDIILLLFISICWDITGIITWGSAVVISSHWTVPF